MYKFYHPRPISTWLHKTPNLEDVRSMVPAEACTCHTMHLLSMHAYPISKNLPQVNPAGQDEDALLAAASKKAKMDSDDWK